MGATSVLQLYCNVQSHIVVDGLPRLEMPRIGEGTAEAVDTNDGPEKHINNVTQSAETMPQQEKHNTTHSNRDISLGEGCNHGAGMSIPDAAFGTIGMCLCVYVSLVGRLS